MGRLSKIAARAAGQRVLYHGSPKSDLAELRPYPAKGMSEFQSGHGVFATDDERIAELYAVGKNLKGKTPFAVTPDRLIVVGDHPLAPGYVYKVPARGSKSSRDPHDVKQYKFEAPVPVLASRRIDPSVVKDRVVRVDSMRELVDLVKTDLQKTAAMSAKEKSHYREGDLGPGVPERAISSLPKIKVPQVWEFSAHPHLAERAGPHIDIRLGNPETGIAHSFVLPKRSELPAPGKSALVVPTYDHTIPYMDFTGRISTEYGKGKVEKGRRTQVEVSHSEPDDKPGTKMRFNLYDGTHPEEFAIVRGKDRWLIVNKTLTRARRPDLPAEKPKYKEQDVDVVDMSTSQLMMPKLDGAHGIIDLQAGRAPRVFSYRTAKKAPTGLIEHTHKLTDLMKDTVPKSLDGTILRGEILAVDRKGKALPAEVIGGMLNTKVWDSRAKQKELGAKLHAFPFDVVKYKGKSMENATFSEKLKVLKQVEKEIGDLWVPEIATTPKEKTRLLSKIERGKYPLTREGVVLVEPDKAGAPTKAKFSPDFDVYVRKVHPAVSGKTGELHDRAGAISYSWTEDGPVVGQLGGFSHDLGRDMLKNPDKYIGRVAKVKAMRVFAGEQGQPGALFQPRFKEWHLDKGKEAGVANVTTRGSDGREHSRPFSFVNRVEGSDPPELGITMLKPGGKTLENVRTTGRLAVDGKPHTVSKIQDADVVFAKEKAAFLEELRMIVKESRHAVQE